MNLLSHCLREPFQSELARVVESPARKPHATAQRANLDHHPSLRSRLRILLPHDPHSLFRDVHRAPEIRIQLLPRLLICGRLCVTIQPITGIIHHDVEAAELRECRLSGSVDRSFRRNVERELEDVGAFGEGGESGELAGSCDYTIRGLRNVGCEIKAYARGAAGYWIQVRGRIADWR